MTDASPARPANKLRTVSVRRAFTNAPGSVLWEQGKTLVLCTATVEQKRPKFFTDDTPGGWVTADYVMHPASVGKGRKDWPDAVRPDKRATEIGRLVGRAIRAAVDVTKLGPHTISLDCTVLQADGGTRTASICGAMIALADALQTLPKDMPGTPYTKRSLRGGIGSEAVHNEDDIPASQNPNLYDPQNALINPLAAVSVGMVDGAAVLDLDYHLDSRAEVDLNVVRTATGKYVELQGNAERGGGFTPAQLADMLKLADLGIDELLEIQRSA